LQMHSVHDENGSMKYRQRKPWDISFRRLRKQPVFTELRNDQLTCENNFENKSKKGPPHHFILSFLSSLWRMQHTIPILYSTYCTYITYKSVSSNKNNMPVEC
jgi:hypothetical protein